MGIFSIFNRRRSDSNVAMDDAVLQRRLADAGKPSPGNEAERLAALERQREIARATALKIDAIEAAMSFDIFNTPEPPWAKRPARRPADAAAPAPDALADSNAQESPPFAVAALLEDIAILFASKQIEMVEQTLLRALRDEALAANTRACWAMLLDFYQIEGKAAQFDNLAIDYASKFESFPPLWSNARYRRGVGAAAYSGVIPTLALPAMLDADADARFERIRALAATHPIIRIECVAVRQFDNDGCLALVQLLKTLQQSSHELILVGAAEMAKLLRSQLRIGHRDAYAPWVLLLEILRLSQREKDYREASVDYRVTYNLSPPPYQPPAMVAVADAQNRQTPGSPDRFMMPVDIVIAASGQLIAAIDGYAAHTAIVVLDCSRLVRIDADAAKPLLACLQLLAAAGKIIELHDVNHLVATLLGVMHFNDVSIILHHRY